MATCSPSYALWVTIWVLIVIFLILAIACRSVILVLLVLAIALGVGMGQCIFKSHRTEALEPEALEPAFSAGSSRGSPTPGETAAFMDKTARMKNAPRWFYPDGISAAEARCAARGGPDSQEEWLPNYEAQRWQDAEGSLGELAEGAIRAAEADTLPRVLPAECSAKPLPCRASIAWQPSFAGCSSTFVESPACKLYKRDPRLWNRRLDDVIQERAAQNGEIWDPYKHFEARQKFAQFLAKDLVNRKDNWMRPIETLEEASCFGKTRPVDAANLCSD